MEEMTIVVRWEGIKGPYGPQEIQKVLEGHYKNTYNVHGVNLDSNQEQPKYAYTAQEAAKLLGISTATVYSLLYQGQIPGVRYGKRWIVSKVGLEKQLGGSLSKEKSLISDAERADLVATIEEGMKLYDLLQGKLKKLANSLANSKG